MAVDPMLAAAQQQVHAAWVQAGAAIAQGVLTVATIAASLWVWRGDRLASFRREQFAESVADFRVAVLLIPQLAGVRRSLEDVLESGDKAVAAWGTPGPLPYNMQVHVAERCTSLVEATSGCSPAVEADVLAVAAFCRQYVQYASTMQRWAQSSTGQMMGLIDGADWALARTALAAAVTRCVQALLRLEQVLKNPPDLQKRRALFE